MPTLTIQNSGKTIDAAAGISILAALLAADEKIPHKCEGKGECGSCHIFVQEGRKSVSKIQRAENEKLDTIPGVRTLLVQYDSQKLRPDELLRVSLTSTSCCSLPSA